MTIISVSIPDDMVKKVDSMTEKYGYSSRSDLIRHALEQLLQQDYEGEGKYRLVIVLSDHEKAMYVDRNIVSLIHGYSEDLKGLYHQLLDGPYCITVAIMKDGGEDWKMLVKRIRALRGVLRVYTLTL
ncbi:MAG: CopG family ribbon-helix-helix protein [Desulfurococcales archaeon]|nr:CopG family ribbon-helix-helix protein [Desulfurococcales archaeon]